MSAALSAARTDTGVVRRTNEDAVLTAAPIFAVADGMGGHAAGDVAAARILDRLGDLGGRTGLQPEDVLACIALANADVVQLAGLDPALAGMGATLAGVCLGRVADSNHWYVFNVGDARVYRALNGRLHQLTVDHSEVQELVDEGRITADEARVHPHRNIVTRSLGTSPAPDVDMVVVPAVPGERFLICSDGLTAELTDDDLGSVLATAAGPSDAVDTLIERALARGARDNVTAVVVELSDAVPGSVDEVTAPRSRAKGVSRA